MMLPLKAIYYCTVLLVAQCLPLKDNEVDSYESGGADLSYLGTSIFGKPSKETGNKVQNWNAESEVNPEELGEYAEGDILFPSKFARNGLIAETARWPDGEIPYEITGYFSKTERDTIRNAMEQYHELTCIRFVPRMSHHPDWISITSSNSGCWSSVGRTGGKQDVNFQTPNCLMKIGTVLHEFLHAAGFQHEQNRWERDDYVSINWQNIQKGKEGNFRKGSKDSVSGFGVPYDYGSVMHYSEKAFSTNGEQTITVLKDTDEKIGQRKGFSDNDLEKIRKMYNCAKTNSNRTDVDKGTDNHENVTGLPGVLGGLISLLLQSS